MQIEGTPYTVLCTSATQVKTDGSGRAEYTRRASLSLMKYVARLEIYIASEGITAILRKDRL